MIAKPFLSLIAAVYMAAISCSVADPAPVQYLAFQIFTASPDSESLEKGFPPLSGTIAEQVDRIIHATGSVGNQNRKLGFIVGPLAFDATDDHVRQLMRSAFIIAHDKNIAVGFHLDDSMFWDRRTDLNKPENIEWLDWNQTPCTGRRLDWSSVPTKIMPQLCFNSPAVESAVKKRAALIGEEIGNGLKMLQAYGQTDLFIGVIAGWETQIGRDFATGKHLGYHALTNKGFSAAHPPADLDQARVEIVRDFVDLWSTSLAQAGVPDDKIYAHTAFMSRAVFDMASFGQPGHFPGTYLETINFTPPLASFGAQHRPGFSTYPQFGFLEQIQTELTANGNPPWASSEGTSGDPSTVEKGDHGGSMENYLGNLYNRGAVLVNIFGWGIGNSSNPFRQIAESPNSIAAYQKFLRGETLASDPPAQVPSTQFFDKMRQLQKELPPYFTKNGTAKVGPLYEELSRDLKAQHYTDAERIIDEILQAIKS
jgi:hypothetical protein